MGSEMCIRDRHGMEQSGSSMQPEVMGCSGSGAMVLRGSGDGAQRQFYEAGGHGLRRFGRSVPSADMGWSRAAVPCSRRSWAAAVRAIHALSRHRELSRAAQTPVALRVTEITQRSQDSGALRALRVRYVFVAL